MFLHSRISQRIRRALALDQLQGDLCYLAIGFGEYKPRGSVSVLSNYLFGKTPTSEGSLLLSIFLHYF